MIRSGTFGEPSDRHKAGRVESGMRKDVFKCER